MAFNKQDEEEISGESKQVHVELKPPSSLELESVDKLKAFYKGGDSTLELKEIDNVLGRIFDRDIKKDDKDSYVNALTCAMYSYFQAIEYLSDLCEFDILGRLLMYGIEFHQNEKHAEKTTREMVKLILESKINIESLLSGGSEDDKLNTLQRAILSVSKELEKEKNNNIESIKKHEEDKKEQLDAVTKH